MSQDPSPDQGHPNRRRILAVLCLSLLIVVVDNTVLNTALPSIARDLGASTSQLQWIVDAYTLVLAALLIVCGSLGDRFGRRGALMAGLVIFALGSTGAALSSGTEGLIAFRAVMGLGGALVMPATLSILSAVFPEKERAGAIGVWSAMAGVGIVVGPTLGGFLLDHYSWASVFWVGVPLAAVALSAVLLVIPAQPGVRAAGSRLDLIGAALATVGMVALVDAVIEGPERGWSDRLTVLELAVGLLLLAGFVLRQLRIEHPLLDVRVFRHRAFSAAVVSVAVIFFALFGSLFALTQYLQLVKDYRPLMAGLGALPFAFAVLVFSPVAAITAVRLGVRVVIPAGLVTMAAGLLLAAQVSPTTSYPYIAISVAVMGAGMALVLAPAGESMISVLPREQAGVGSAVNDTMQELGGTLGVAVLGSIVSAAYRSGLDTAALPGLPDQAREAARESLGAADAVAAQAGPLGSSLSGAADAAFTTAMTHGFTVAAVAALLGAVIGIAYLPRRVRPVADGASGIAPTSGATTLTPA